MKLNKKYSILSILTLISSPTYSQLYMCKACPGGTYAASGASSCTSCSAGTYSYAGASSCTPCPAGQYQNIAGQTGCKNCRAGSYSTGRASSCTSCPAGKYQASIGQSYCNTCPAGTYSTGGATSCKTCPAGTYSNAGASSCSPCPAGQWQNASGQSSCKSCSQMRVYYGVNEHYTSKRTPELKWNTIYTCGNDLFGDPYGGAIKHCAKDAHKKVFKYYIDGAIMIENEKFQIICDRTTGKKCIADENGNYRECLDKDYSW